MDSLNELVFDLLSRAEKSRQKELAIALKKMGPIDDHQKEVVNELTSKLVSQLFQPVVENIRRAAEDEPKMVEAASKLLISDHN